MACPRCGDHCLCSPVGDCAFVRLSVSDVIPSTRETRIGFIHPAAPRARNSGVAVAEPENEAWRNEIASRVQAHRAKRKRKISAHDSLSLEFDSAIDPLEQADEVATAVMNTDAIVADSHPADHIYPRLEYASAEPLTEASHTFDVLAEENAEP